MTNHFAAGRALTVAYRTVIMWLVSFNFTCNDMNENPIFSLYSHRPAAGGLSGLRRASHAADTARGLAGPGRRGQSALCPRQAVPGNRFVPPQFQSLAKRRHLPARRRHLHEPLARVRLPHLQHRKESPLSDGERPLRPRGFLSPDRI